VSLQLRLCTPRAVSKLIYQTLAVGVNLPAHLVIIKGTQTWSGVVTGMREYSDVDIQQMMGRAGRPQYDNSGTVIIMCEKGKVAMVSQQELSHLAAVLADN
jgi:replicative superfamily II helicase